MTYLILPVIQSEFEEEVAFRVEITKELLEEIGQRKRSLLHAKRMTTSTKSRTGTRVACSMATNCARFSRSSKETSSSTLSTTLRSSAVRLACTGLGSRS